MFHLIVENNERADAYLPVSWCIGPEERGIILKTPILKPHVLLVVAELQPNPHYREEATQHEQIYEFVERNVDLIPLSEGTKYLTFDHPGKYRLFATIVGDETGDIKKLRKTYLSRRASWIVDRTGEFSPSRPFLRKAEMDITVGEEFFAPEPPQWEKNYMALWPWFNKKPADQCNLRRRRMFAYTLMPVLLLVWWVLYTIIAGFVYSFSRFLGMRDIKFRPVWDHRQDFSDVFNDDTPFDSVFITNKDGDFRIATIPFHPVALFLMFLLSGWVFGQPSSASEVFLHLLYVYLGVYLVMPIIWLIFLGIGKMYKKYQPTEEEVRARQVALQEERLQSLVCDTMAEYGGHPPRRSLRLRFNGIKSQVCRPMRKY